MRLALPLVGAAVLAACSCSTTSSGVVRGPMLQQGTHRSVLVSWHTEEAAPSRLEWGAAPGAFERVAGDGVHRREHLVRIEGLRQGQPIHYRVDDPDDGWVVGRFDPLPAPGGAGGRPIRIWVLGDSGTGGRNQRRVRNAMREAYGGDGLDMMIHVGDIAYEAGTEKELQERFFEVYRQMLPGLVVWPALGNHEARSVDVEAQEGPWFEAFTLPTEGECGGVPSGTESWYSFDAGNAHVVVLDSSESSLAPDGAMLRWLERDLAAAREATWKIAVVHHPPYSRGSHDSDEEEAPTRVRENALPILEAGGVDLVLSGHSHGYERTALIHGAYGTPAVEAEAIDATEPYEKRGSEGTIYVVAGHGGRRIHGDFDHPLVVVADRDYGSLYLEIDGDVLRARNVEADGNVGDRFEIRKR